MSAVCFPAPCRCEHTHTVIAQHSADDVKHSCFDNFLHGYLALYILIYFQSVFTRFQRITFYFYFIIKVKFKLTVRIGRAVFLSLWV